MFENIFTHFVDLLQWIHLQIHLKICNANQLTGFYMMGEHWPLNGLIYPQTLGESFFQTFLVGCFFKEIILNKKLRVL